jgi:hypothetical protein
MNSFLTGASATAPVDVGGTERVGDKRPVGYKYTVGIQREVGWHTVVDLAYVGERTRNLALNWNYNQIPAGARFQAENRDPTRTPTAANPGALPDVFLRPIVGFGNINISSPVGSSAASSSPAATPGRRATRPASSRTTRCPPARRGRARICRSTSSSSATWWTCRPAAAW